MKRTISCLQFNISYGNPSENFKKAERLIEAESSHADILVLPELWTTGYDLKNLDTIGDEDGKQTKTWLQKTAKANNVHIVCGSVAVKKKNGVYNTMYIADKNGNLIKEYSKAHLFQLMDEHLYLSSGSADGSFEIEGARAAGFICYDIRFPEWIRKHTSKGAGIIFVSAEWPRPRLDHWRSLLIARAIENQCFVAACNCSGKDPANEFAGHSMVIDPLGHVLAEAGHEETVVKAEIDLNDIDQARGQIPVFEDIRKDLY
ncbi:carbon-nitrogen family hydrolase [Bacillus swezeyi]|uniref:Carbon-nitrogen hydrolase n=1 Tax=Bacillus swezeyi TaxID=1925020 RepID=A0A1R1QYS0_9BACI|nr:carbon-nitrogen family hydrolase [Bacillus swezeyi]MEC1262389.1 carbon-nitrogen family hydrolase [Bacillus swezeyi]MED2926902.1 carbon-nitrogen family hydrolase [Bacillus swezeyi]MED2943320.1 carbon-nitrogen family hydrolase [Bacillus swezeyi]MED2965536.1 carbon-nitrogen family hydrolase [Bacillus swezeyi]MED3071061.1 carbon-nitrogen family hydrolase [Bacillus swezeyi]